MIETVRLMVEEGRWALRRLRRVAYLVKDVHSVLVAPRQPGNSDAGNCIQ